MFDIGFFELLLVGIVGLLVVGPERLPDAVRTTARWWSGVKRTLVNAKNELEREVGADDIRRELHNERILRELRESRQEVEQALQDPDWRDPEELPDHYPHLHQEQDGEEPHDPMHPSADAEDYLPEQDEDAEDLQDPEYPEHWHDYGDPELNEHHPDNLARAEREAEEELRREREQATRQAGDRDGDDGHGSGGKDSHS